MTSGRGAAGWVAVALGWLVVVAVAGVLAVVGLRAAGDPDGQVVLTPEQALALAGDQAPTPAPSGTPSPSPTATPTPTASPTPTTPSPTATAAPVTERRVPGAVLGLRCAGGVPSLVWSVPDPGWRLEEAEVAGSGLRVRLASDDDRVRVTVACSAGVPVITDVERQEGSGSGTDDDD